MPRQVRGVIGRSKGAPVELDLTTSPTPARTAWMSASGAGSTLLTAEAGSSYDAVTLIYQLTPIWYSGECDPTAPFLGAADAERTDLS